MFKGKSGQIDFTFEATGDFDGILTISCPHCDKPKSLRLSEAKPNELIPCACGAQKADIESFRKTIREEVMKLAKDAFKDILK